MKSCAGVVRSSVLAAAAIIVACGPTDAGISAKVKTNLAADETAKTAQINVGWSPELRQTVKTLLTVLTRPAF